MDCSPPGFSVHGILQARIVEWISFPSPEELPNPGIEPWSPALQADSLLFELQESSYTAIKINLLKKKYIYDSNSATEKFEHLGPVVGTLYFITLSCCFTGLYGVGLQNLIVIWSWDMWKKDIRRSSPKVCFCFTLMVQIWASHLCLCGSIFSSLNESFGPVIFLRSHPTLTIQLAKIPFKIPHFCLSKVIYLLILSSYTLYLLVLLAFRPYFSCPRDQQLPNEASIAC